MKELNALGPRLKHTREELKLTQEEFGRQMGCCKTTVIHYENGKRVPDARFLIDLARKFGISLDWLLLGRGKMIGPFPYYGGEDTDGDLHNLLEHLRIPAVKLSIMAEYYRLKSVLKPLLEEFDRLHEKDKTNNA